ncbi:MAG: hypothetical protein KBS95_03255 [Alistipes sp.]|nr:hypothetical protein [Candidatus Alistipes equi]
MLKKLLYLICIVVPAVLSADTISNYFSSLDHSIKALGVYRVDFRLESNGETFNGYYIVKDHDFFFCFMGEEVYSHKDTRYIIDTNRKEVTILSSEDMSHDFLDNPAMDFSKIPEIFDAKEVGQDIILTYKDSSKRDESVRICRKTSSPWPECLVLNSSAASITMYIESIHHYNEPFPLYASSKYSGYIISDMRAKIK